MTMREQFTDDQWAGATALPSLVIMAASLAEGKMLPSIREMRQRSRHSPQRARRGSWTRSRMAAAASSSGAACASSSAATRIW